MVLVRAATRTVAPGEERVRAVAGDLARDGQRPQPRRHLQDHVQAHRAGRQTYQMPGLVSLSNQVGLFLVERVRQ